VSNLTHQVERLHRYMDKAALRALSMLLGFVNTGLFMWSPEAYADQIAGFTPLLGFLFVWSVCASMVYGIGFKPRFWLWQIVFSPYFCLSILIYFTISYYF
jgi:cyd operon protein YbgE